MSARVRLLAVRLAALLALGVSAALLVDYTRPVPAFCAVGSGCDKVRAAAGTIAGVPVPVIGLVGFAALFVATIARGGAVARLARPMALLGGAGGLVFVGVQLFVLRTVCTFCLVVDGAAVAAGLAALAPLAAGDAAAAERVRWAWAPAGLLVAAVPLIVGLSWPSPEVPRAIAELWIPGRINVVEFTDFECPFCRKLHPDLEEAMRAYAGRLHHVRLNMPLPQHAQARAAARAWCCAREQGKEAQMAHRLFDAPATTPADCERLAEAIGLSLPAFRACVASAATERAIDADVERVRAAGWKGLPTVWIQDQVLVGAHSLEALRDAFRRAEEALADGGARRAPRAAQLVGGLAAALAGAVALGLALRRRDMRRAAG